MTTSREAEERQDEDRLKEIEARANAATPGPWYVQYGYDLTGARNDVSVVSHDEDKECYPILDQENLPSYDSCEFIAHAREDIPWLISEVRRLMETQVKVCDHIQVHKITCPICEGKK